MQQGGAEISEVKYTLRGEIATLRTENDTALSALNTQMGAQNQALKELADAANATSDMIQELEDKVKKLSGQVEALTEKCLDLEGRSKRQNLRVAGVKEGSENGQKPREFVAQLLKEVLNLADAPVIDGNGLEMMNPPPGTLSQGCITATLLRI